MSLDGVSSYDREPGGVTQEPGGSGPGDVSCVLPSRSRAHAGAHARAHALTRSAGTLGPRDTRLRDPSRPEWLNTLCPSQNRRTGTMWRSSALRPRQREPQSSHGPCSHPSLVNPRPGFPLRTLPGAHPSALASLFRLPGAPWIRGVQIPGSPDQAACHLLSPRRGVVRMDGWGRPPLLLRASPSWIPEQLQQGPRMGWRPWLPPGLP